MTIVSDGFKINKTTSVLNLKLLSPKTDNYF